ncbi:hypothetical protein NC653_003093 [Populus alba x Populus x berolinensis]|uniref:Uncharacterized protein n=1 Tax=Populus alba x Populus x berolinensis TaxID=444605 RepID=A0AAD6WHS1_9ROSI|nr:hypothetical protein NC653_003093 [Populus alba x Populus x berolinensis]
MASVVKTVMTGRLRVFRRKSCSLWKMNIPLKERRTTAQCFKHGIENTQAASIGGDMMTKLKEISEKMIQGPPFHMVWVIPLVSSS